MIGSLVGLAGSVVGGILSANQRRKAERERKAAIEADKAANKAWYERRYHEDATERADAKRAIAKMEQYLRDRNKDIAGRQAVMGGTDEAVAAAKQQGVEAMGNTIADIGAAGAARKDAVEADYRAQDAALRAEERGVAQAQSERRAGELNKAIGAITNTAGNIADIYNDDKKVGK